MRSIIRPIIYVIVFIIAVGIIIYPSVEDYIISIYHKYDIDDYKDQVNETIENNQYDEVIRQVHEYNAKVLFRDLGQVEEDSPEHQEYENILNYSPDGMIGYIAIPKIDVSLPIYHGATANNLQHGAAHVEGTSFPMIDEITSHVGISAHTGLSSAVMFDNLVSLREGDIFYINILDKRIFYQIDKITVTTPDDISVLAFEEGQNYCSLITCTPFGINTHRLIARGKMIDNPYPDDFNDDENVLSLLVSRHEEIYYVLSISLAISFILYMILKRKKIVENLEE